MKTQRKRQPSISQGDRPGTNPFSHGLRKEPILQIGQDILVLDFEPPELCDNTFLMYKSLKFVALFLFFYSSSSKAIYWTYLTFAIFTWKSEHFSIFSFHFILWQFSFHFFFCQMLKHLSLSGDLTHCYDSKSIFQMIKYKLQTIFPQYLSPELWIHVDQWLLAILM